LFFLAGIPIAFLLERAIARLSLVEVDRDAGGDSELGGPPEVRFLPWQVGPLPLRVRMVVVALTPFLMAAAGLRLDLAPAVIASFFAAAMLVCTATDLIRFRVPNLVTYPGTLIALG